MPTRRARSGRDFIPEGQEWSGDPPEGQGEFGRLDGHRGDNGGQWGERGIARLDKSGRVISHLKQGHRYNGTRYPNEVEELLQCVCKEIYVCV